MPLQQLESLVAASFKGVPFRVRIENVEQGRRKILHEYPKADTRFIEDNGFIPPRFSITAFVHGTDYRQQAAALRAALNEEGSGRLTINTFGSFEVEPMPFVERASQRATGVIEFDIEFATTRATAGPIEAAPEIEDVYGLGDDARSAIGGVIPDIWQIPVDIDNALTAELDLTSITEALTSVRDTVSGAVADAEALGNDLINISRNVAEIVRNPSQIASTLIGSTQAPGAWQLVSLITTGVETFDAVVRLTEWGTDLGEQIGGLFRATPSNDVVAFENPLTAPTAVPLWPPTTAQRIRRNVNRRALVQVTRLNAMIVAYEQAAARDYATSEDVENTREQIETVHDRLMRVEIANDDAIQARPEVRFAIGRLRTAALTVLEQKEQNAYQLVEYDTPAPVSAAVLSYRLYAENLTSPEALTDRALFIAGLNSAQPSTALTNGLTVVRRRG